MRLAAAVARGAVGGLRGGVLPPEAMQLALQVVRLRGRRRVVRQRGALPRAPRLVQRVAPRAVQLHELRAVQAARAGEAHHVRLLLAPAGQRRGPLLRAPRLVRHAAAHDHAAVDEAVDDRRQLARGDRDHRLVEQREPFGDPPALDQQDADVLRRQREQVRVAGALAERDRLGPQRDRRVRVARRHLHHAGQLQVAALDALRRLALDEPPGAGDPAGRAGPLPADVQVDGDPERAARGAQPVAVAQMVMVGPLQPVDVLVVAPEHVRGRGQPLEVLWGQRLGGGEGRVGLAPCAPRVGRPAAVELVRARHGAIIARRVRAPPGWCTDPMRGYHDGQRAVQRRAGDTTVAERLERGIHPALADVAQEFLAGLPLLFVAVTDAAGHVWASVLSGPPGFIDTPDDRTLTAAALPPAGSPLAQALGAGPAAVGLLGDRAADAAPDTGERDRHARTARARPCAPSRSTPTARSTSSGATSRRPPATAPGDGRARRAERRRPPHGRGRRHVRDRDGGAGRRGRVAPRRRARLRHRARRAPPALPRLPRQHDVHDAGEPGGEPARRAAVPRLGDRRHAPAQRPRGDRLVGGARPSTSRSSG